MSWVNSLFMVGQFVGFLLFTIVVHELGHSWTAHKLGYRVKMRFFSTDVYGLVTKEDSRKIAFWGVFAGFLPVLLYSSQSHIFLGLGMALIYVVGVREELKEVLI